MLLPNIHNNVNYGNLFYEFKRNYGFLLWDFFALHEKVELYNFFVINNDWNLLSFAVTIWEICGYNKDNFILYCSDCIKNNLIIQERRKFIQDTLIYK